MSVYGCLYQSWHKRKAHRLTYLIGAYPYGIAVKLFKVLSQLEKAALMLYIAVNAASMLPYLS